MNYILGGEDSSVGLIVCVVKAATSFVSTKIP